MEPRVGSLHLSGRTIALAMIVVAFMLLASRTGPPGTPSRSNPTVSPTQPTATTAVATSTPTPTLAPTTTTTPIESTTTFPAPAAPPKDVSREIPSADPVSPPPAAPPPPWAGSVTTTGAGYISTAVGCAASRSAASLDAFFAARIGPLIGADYQHVSPLGGERFAWFFQDAFIDPTGTATRLDQAHFTHNLLLVQDGNCFTMLHRGTAGSPKSFEPGRGEDPKARWFWPMGSDVSGGTLRMFWAEMVRDPYDPGPGDGLGWHPVRMWLATYDARTMARQSFVPAPNDGANPLYGYAVASDSTHTYLFGNTFEQNLVREGGYLAGRHSATVMWLARVPLGQLGAAPEYRTADGWSQSAADARPFLQRYWVENPMQPRFLGGQWIAATKVDGYWGESLVIDVANNPWGPWTTIEDRGLAPRNGDPKMNTYHAHLLPWRSGSGAAIVSVSQNARLMARDAFPHPERYRLMVFTAAWSTPPPDPVPTTTTTSTTTTTTTSTTTTTTTTTTADTTTTTDISTSSSTPSTSTPTITTTPTSTTVTATTVTASTTSTTVATTGSG